MVALSLGATSPKGEQMIPKGYKHTELGVLPEDWEVVRLGDILEYEQPTKYLVSNIEYDNSYTTPVLTAGKTFILGYTDEVEGIYTNLPIILFDDFTTASQYVDFPFKVKSSACKILKLKKTEFSLRVVFEVMQRLNFVADDHKRYWISEYQNQEIFLPNAKEQRGIAEILSAWDTQIQNFETLITEKQTLKKGLCQTLLTAKTRLKGFSGDWEVVRLGDVCEIRNGFAFQSKKFKKSGFPIVRISNIKSNNSISLKNMVYFSSDDYKNKDLKNFIVHQNDVLVALSGATTGKIGKMKEDVILYLNQRVGRFQPSERLNNDFLYQCLLLQSNILFLLSGGGAQPNLSTTTIKNKIFIPLPPLAEQEKIAEILSEADNEITLLEQKLESLKSQKRGLMQNLLNGKVRVKS